MAQNPPSPNRFTRIEAVIRLVPKGKVASYGDIAAITGGVTPRHVGFALAASNDPDLPWQRIINSQGGLSPRGADGAMRQRETLEAEGVHFNQDGTINWLDFGWEGPALDWFLDKGVEVEQALSILSAIRRRHEKTGKKRGK